MKILMVSKFLYMRGGLERVMFDEAQWLRERGHTVAFFGTAHSDNESTQFDDILPPYFELGGGGKGLSRRAQLRVVASSIHSFAAARALRAAIRRYDPDVVHFHGIHRHLSPSVLMCAHALGKTTVQTFHDYNRVCPNALLLRGMCEPCMRECRGIDTRACIKYRCVKGSLAASSVAAFEHSVQTARRVYPHMLDAVVTPSLFLSHLLMEEGFRRDRLHLLRNAVHASAEPAPLGSQILFAGRLSLEKGVQAAISAATAAGIHLRVVGDGPLRYELERDYGRSASFSGWLESAELQQAIRDSRAVVVPSLTPENSPLSILEAMAEGKAVIASNLGSMPELVTAETGLLVPPGDTDSLATAFRMLTDDPAAACSMGTAGWNQVRQHFSPASHVSHLESIYEQASDVSYERKGRAR